MIARVWRGRTRLEHADEYADYVKGTGVIHHRQTSGNRGSMIFRRLRGDVVEFLVVSLWDTLHDVHNFAGQDPEVAVYFPEDDKYLLEFEPKVRHYDVPTIEIDHGATHSDSGGTAAEVDYQNVAPIHFMR